MKLYNKLIIGLICLSYGFISVGQTEPPRVFAISGSTLVDAKQQWSGNKRARAALSKLSTDADHMMDAGPFTVTSALTKRPSGDNHDYISLCIYAWPSSDKPGSPYVIRDGQVNPEVYSNLYANRCFWDMINTVSTLSTAWYFTEKEKYAERATKLIRVFFLDDATHMNPNLNYAQIRPGVSGKSSGTSIGIVDAQNLIKVVDAVGLLNNSQSWTEADQKGMQAWFGAYLNWLLHSQAGKEQSSKSNNLSTGYDAQVLSCALFIGDKKIATDTINRVMKRIDTQIAPDGSQPLELTRTLSLHYSLMNLNTFMCLANMSKTLNVDLWNYTSPKGSGIRKAVDFMVPYIGNKRDRWPYPQLTKQDPNDGISILYQASVAYNDPRYASVVGKLDVFNRHNLLYPSKK